ncbi:MAG: acyloxyacyl hydrolase [Burkholderiales bacterium]|jgi:hypothetical protein|nr:acyloxyacyl hydrolase [Burkholderiales bacterium]
MNLLQTAKALAASGFVALTATAQAQVPGAAPRFAGFDLVHAGVRARVGGERVIGREQPEAFRQWDVWVNARLPWLRRYEVSGLGVETRLLCGAGVMQGAEDRALVLSLLPTLAFGSVDAAWNFDLGAGLALLSRHTYAQQDFGGHAQFALTAGLSAPLTRRLGIGYRFMHYSDAGIYGDTIGADFHMVELFWRY